MILKYFLFCSAWFLALGTSAFARDIGPCAAALTRPAVAFSDSKNPHFDQTRNQRRKSTPHLPNNWAWDISGIDLIRNDARFTRGDYAHSKLAVIDTGLRLNGNPDAGAKLLAKSPEIEWDPQGHGTGVIGVAASERYGVNPNLDIETIPSMYHDVELHLGNIVDHIEGRVGFDEAQLIASIKKAIDDPHITVINASLSSLEHKEILELYKIAMRKGKWVVVPPSNSQQKVNDLHTNGIIELSKFPEFFVVGALSYFAAPASFAHRGPETQYYAPGTDIETLSASYNPNFLEPRASKSFNGGSFASPHFAALLATVRALLPGITTAAARALIDNTSIARGTSRKILQVNSYFVLWATLRARALLEKHECTVVSDCLNIVVTNVSQEIARIQRTLANPATDSTPGSS